MDPRRLPPTVGLGLTLLQLDQCTSFLQYMPSTNVNSLAKAHAKEQLLSDLQHYQIGISIISETKLKNTIANSSRHLQAMQHIVWIGWVGVVEVSLSTYRTCSPQRSARPRWTIESSSFSGCWWSVTHMPPWLAGSSTLQNIPTPSKPSMTTLGPPWTTCYTCIRMLRLF